ncbi:hypothetical protein MERGE_002394 [Pneumocystis wakefieldiae]|uniref:PCI domain-containing protein n=1 Tax=Pneumocystis wakefieldiae TaxID=38082 RepID=A0A899G0R7_9ASCO|nr:hypothetical protein MERGE_002394 [Pneumocystis wakefieldiae]
MAALPDKSWVEAALCFWRASLALGKDQDVVKATDEQLALVQAVLKGFVSWEAWVLPVLFAVCRDLEILACRADAVLRRRNEKAEKSEEAARMINKAFTMCITDRYGSGKNIYFKINKFSLSKNVLRAIEVSEMPPLECFPKSHVVTYKYYLGVSAFLNEEYTVAETELMASLELCEKNSAKNLKYLADTHVSCSDAYLDIAEDAIQCLVVEYIRKGDLKRYDQLLMEREKELMGKRIYLAIERIRDMCMRNLFRRVFILNQRSTKIPIDQFHIALKHAGLDIEIAETECFLANMIYKGFIKGYIHQGRQMVILSVKDPFPKTVKLSNLLI